MNRDELARYLDAIYDCRLTNNSKAVTELFAEKALFRLAGSSDSGLFPPPVSTPAERDAVLEQMVTAWEWLEVLDRTSIIDDNRATVRYTLKVRFTPSGDVFETELCDCLTFDECGKILEFVEFVDTELVARLVAALPES